MNPHPRRMDVLRAIAAKAEPASAADIAQAAQVSVDDVRAICKAMAEIKLIANANRGGGRRTALWQVTEAGKHALKEPWPKHARVRKTEPNATYAWPSRPCELARIYGLVVPARGAR